MANLQWTKRENIDQGTFDWVTKCGKFEARVKMDWDTGKKDGWILTDLNKDQSDWFPTLRDCKAAAKDWM